MSCPHCLSTFTSKRKHRTALGYRTFFCGDCGRRFNERSGSPFNDLQFPTDIVLLAVLWRLRYKLSFREVAELLLQRGFEISTAKTRSVQSDPKRRHSFQCAARKPLVPPPPCNRPGQPNDTGLPPADAR